MQFHHSGRWDGGTLATLSRSGGWRAKVRTKDFHGRCRWLIRERALPTKIGAQ